MEVKEWTRCYGDEEVHTKLETNSREDESDVMEVKEWTRCYGDEEVHTKLEMDSREDESDIMEVRSKPDKVKEWRGWRAILVL